MKRSHASDNLLVAAISPSPHGFGYVVFEGPQKLVDWGVRDIRQDKNRQSLEKVRDLVGWYSPDVLVLENCTVPASRRSARIKRLTRAVLRLAQRQKLTTRSYARAEIKAAFAEIGAKTRYEIAQAIAEQVPDLGLWLPPPRKIWQSEDPRMSIFDAASLASAFFHEGVAPSKRAKN